jgi:hypothetical protein
VVNDNLNLSKSILNKFKDLSTDTLSISLEESEKAYAILANVLNITVVKNRWLMEWSQLDARVKGIFKSLAGGLYVGAASRQGRGGEGLTNHWYSYVHGPAVIRL